MAYPVFSGFTGFKAQGLANGYVVAQADSFIGDFKDNLSQAVDMPAAEASTLTGTFAVHEEAHHIVSVTFSVSEYESGMAHPNNYEDTENYSTLTGSKVALKDLFIPDSDYLTLIADQANPILDKKLTDAGFKDWFREGAKPTADNYDDFFLTATGLDIIFNPYQVAPYVMGAVTIEIPFDAFGAKLVLPQ